jgi:hypothetical protein
MALRLFGGLSDNFALRQHASLLNGLVLLVFIATMAILIGSNTKRGTR